MNLWVEGADVALRPFGAQMRAWVHRIAGLDAVRKYRSERPEAGGANVGYPGSIISNHKEPSKRRGAAKKGPKWSSL